MRQIGLIGLSSGEKIAKQITNQEINDKLKEGAEISADGVISFPVVDEIEDIVTSEITETESESSKNTDLSEESIALAIYPLFRNMIFLFCFVL